MAPLWFSALTGWTLALFWWAMSTRLRRGVHRSFLLGSAQGFALAGTLFGAIWLVTLIF